MNSGVKSSGSSPLVRGQLGEVFGHIVGDRIIPARAGPTRAKSARIPIPSDHPRSCGANPGDSPKCCDVRGSSPLVRGQRRYSELPHIRWRIIPARAGPTSTCRRDRGSSSDHPRSCGANSSVSSSLAGASGSSPLVRGQRSRRSTWTASGRIIPARAGPTPSAAQPSYSGADHPRSCGANCVAPIGGGGEAGSSPLVRGQPGFVPPGRVLGRIIPARAGPTERLPLQVRQDADHPRSCGANDGNSNVEFGSCGSSPLVRGQPARIADPSIATRIIPARAGPTAPPPARASRSADHPRSCGANAGTQNYHTSDGGSSPLVRGQHPLAVAIEDPARIIPARAGPTRRSAPAWRAPPDHPRSCGANGHAGRHGRRLAGSSPLVRGQPLFGRIQCEVDRIIPARAGPTP